MLFKKKEKEEEKEKNNEEEYKVLHKKSIKEALAPAGIDASRLDHMEIISNVTRYARSFFVSGLPRSCIFPELFRNLYMFGDINTSIYIYPISEVTSQKDLNKTIVELETERLLANEKGNINRESDVAQKRYETEILRDQIAAGFNKLYEATIVSTLFAYSMQDLERLTKLLSNEMSKSLVSIKSAWAMQEDAFKTCLPLMNNLVGKKQIFDRPSMGTIFPFVTSEIGHATGVPLGINKQTGEPILFDNFHPSLTNYNMVIFAKSGARKICYNENFNLKVSSLNGNRKFSIRC